MHLARPLPLCTFSVAHLSSYSASVSREVKCQADKLFLGAELGKGIQALNCVDEKTNIQLPIGANFVTKRVTQRCELEYGPDGDLWPILFRLIDRRIGHTEVIKVTSHFEGVGPSAIHQKRKGFSSHASEILGGCRSGGN